MEMLVANPRMISPQQYIEILTDPGSFRETHTGLASGDPLQFKDLKKYKDRIKEYAEKTGVKDALVTGFATMGEREIVLGIMDFSYMGGSMGSVVGEKFARAAQDAILRRRPLIVVSRSGGARMQESIYSLMQMAKTSAMLARLSEEGLPFISILTNPTTGGVTASFASLGDVIIAEPKALIGFAGPRVIQQTIRQDLPEGFQRSEFLLEHGMIDMIVPRDELRARLETVLEFMGAGAASVSDQDVKDDSQSPAVS
jgi:acetyl-CoA carboxylase carboxyl transferase subunit beta